MTTLLLEPSCTAVMMTATASRVQMPRCTYWRPPPDEAAPRLDASLLCAQGRVFELTDRDGRVAAVVLKAAKSGALISNIQREWGVGQKVTSLQDDKGYLPGFMKVGAVILRSPVSMSSCPVVSLLPLCTPSRLSHRRSAVVAAAKIGTL